MVYQPDQQGNRMSDFSYAGYRASEVQIPTVLAKVVVGDPVEDNTRAIQDAIDQVARFEANSDGFRGAVLIPPGIYRLQGSLRLNVSGVVLRGSGVGEQGTTLVATGIDRRALIMICGEAASAVGAPCPIIDPYIPVNAKKLRVQGASAFSAGDLVQISHPSTKEWIEALGMNDFGGDRHGPSWRPGSRDIHWTRVVTQVDGDTLSLDAPLTLGLDAALGTSTLTKLNGDHLVRNVGTENLRISSTFEQQNPKDEEHAWFGVTIDNARDVWVRRLTCEHLAGSAVAVWETSSRVTVEDCKNLRPIGEIGGLRRNSFFASGQQVLMQRLYSESGIHDFAVGATAAGPNAFVQCESHESLGESGTIDSAACGTLLDDVRIDGQPLSLRNRGYQGQGVGWSSFNGVLWNCTASVIFNERPPAAQNWAVGTHGEYSGNGTWISSDDKVNPASLFYSQLAQRLGKDVADRRAFLNLPPVQGSRAPTREQAAAASEAMMKSRVDMDHWIDTVIARNPIDVSATGLPRTGSVEQQYRPGTSRQKPIVITNGWITIDGSLVIGREASVPWWNGGVRPSDLAQAIPALTRFVPGRFGTGLTDDLSTVAETMLERGQVSIWQHPPLWYERRRDDHTRVKRMDGDVVAPFYETPWARSGQGTAWDGLSKWDVTKTNPWYFERLRSFADIGSEKGLILFNGLYMQHNLLEAGAHYADAPWRPTNNVNRVGIPEPVLFASDKLIYVAQQFYDIKDPDRAELHRTYMRNVLKELADKPNVILFLSEEYTGPLEFVQFWLDVVAKWKAETKKNVHVALCATKDVTDTVLNDEKRAAVVTLIDNRAAEGGWFYQPDGSLYGPQAGQNLSPRQWERLLKPKSAGFDQVIKTVREYRSKYPDKPFVYHGAEPLAWAVLLGGGSLPALPMTTEPKLLAAIPKMKPMKDRIGLTDDAGNQLIYSDQRPSGSDVRPIDIRTGRITKGSTKVFWTVSQ